jgi:uncharacterized membrane protein YbjE (DUF340 family)
MMNAINLTNIKKIEKYRLWMVKAITHLSCVLLSLIDSFIRVRRHLQCNHLEKCLSSKHEISAIVSYAQLASYHSLLFGQKKNYHDVRRYMSILYLLVRN